ncbi:MAG: cellulase family glycosylhydrolase, partial [Butyribacter sp.]|nr:cellulase family glycosylhydrolase [Butyribacter sp.]
NTWGSDAEVEEMAGKIALLKEYFTDKKIPVLVGEFGTGLDNDTKSRIKFCKELTRRCKKIGIPVFFWDNGGEFDRENLTWRTKGLAEAMLKAAKTDKK